MHSSRTGPLHLFSCPAKTTSHECGEQAGEESCAGGGGGSCKWTPDGQAEGRSHVLVTSYIRLIVLDCQFPVLFFSVHHTLMRVNYNPYLSDKEAEVQRD